MKPSSDPFAPRAQKGRSALRTRPARDIPFEFVLEVLAPLQPNTRPMFGCTAVYLDERIVCVLRKKGDADDGVWLAYEAEREAEVLALFPALKPITLFPESHGWRKLSAKLPEFEQEVLRACTLLRAGDPRLGKVPVSRKKAARKAASKAPRRGRGSGEINRKAAKSQR